MSLQKKLNNSFLTHLHYYIIKYLSKLLNIINASIYYYCFINWHKSVEYCLEKWGTVEVEGENQLKKVRNMKSGKNLSISWEQKIIPLSLIRSVVPISSYIFRIKIYIPSSVSFKLTVRYELHQRIASHYIILNFFVTVDNRNNSILFNKNVIVDESFFALKNVICAYRNVELIKFFRKTRTLSFI
jgi:hypothetical protein